MREYQKEVQREQLKHEENVLKQLKDNYEDAIKEVKAWLKKLMDAPITPEKKARQAKYQLMLEAQLETILHKLGSRNVDDMTRYLETVYSEAYLGCLYGMHQDKVDLVLQIDEDKMRKVVNKDTKELKFSKRIYNNVNQLKKDTKEQLMRGFSTGKDYLSIARQISLRAGISLNRAYTIARTEGHRVQSEADMDCFHAAQDAGADVVKEWNSTLDAITRDTHRELDGQIREIDEAFVIPSSGAKAMYPGGFGIASEDINCRCCMNQRARWNLQSRGYKYSRFSGSVVKIESKNYAEWKKYYNEQLEKKIEDKLTDEDIKALYDYMSFDAYTLNEALRNGWDLTTKQQELIEKLDAALDKLPAYRGNLVRSLDFMTTEALMEFVDPLEVGTIHNSRQYVSCSYGEIHNPDGNVQIYIRNSSIGKDISRFNEKEKEVLYKRGVQFRVLSATIQEGVFYFLLEEV